MRLSPSAEEALRSHAWPGNVRELENVMQRAVIMAPGENRRGRFLASSSAAIALVVGASVAWRRSSGLLVACRSEAGGAAPIHMRDLEREHILETLAAVGGSRKLAIERLGMSERTLRYKLKQYQEAGLFNE